MHISDRNKSVQWPPLKKIWVLLNFSVAKQLTSKKKNIPTNFAQHTAKLVLKKSLSYCQNVFRCFETCVSTTGNQGVTETALKDSENGILSAAKLL